MERSERWLALVVLVGICAFLGAGCQGQPQVRTDNETVNEAPGEAGEPAAESSPEAAASPAAPGAEPARITAEQLVDVFKDSNVLLLDVRPPEEIEEFGTVEGYVNIPIDDLEARLDELPRDQPILTA
jgi:hypothetical protein